MPINPWITPPCGHRVPTFGCKTCIAIANDVTYICEGCGSEIEKENTTNE